MIGRSAGTMAGLLLLGACAQLGGEPIPPMDTSVAPESLEFANVRADYDRAVEQSFTEMPFANGALSVTGPDGMADLATYRLVPCRGGQAICAGSDAGPAGQLRRTPDWFVVTGLYGRTFWLSYGGDGYVQRGGEYWPIAWNARPNGTGDGDAPSLETPYPHGYRTLDERVAVPVGSAGGAMLPLGNPPQAQGPGRPLTMGADSG
ncbi:hypothetical protein Rumeso_04033 [Rubellimicrobium mesophilum DSM 19309]|uniref:Lipoprotein n=1 Tax=Rubellimicrobium mesophilum DSM 19309 TaxID=442562 RepID=A0A017HJK3_9RHOB|nr:hypothetical protein [Rubellimicrobium mesophilum]EYD74348.1 hypothetical protein Rumeso_04033 [Rubellimicrobium mesophilum DSM 19309]